VKKVLQNDVLKLDEAAEVERTGARLRDVCSNVLRRRGLVVALVSVQGEGLYRALHAKLNFSAPKPEPVAPRSSRKT
jgi:hypothetical protein